MILECGTKRKEECLCHRIIKNDEQKCLCDTAACHGWVCIPPARQVEQNELSGAVYVLLGVTLCVHISHSIKIKLSEMCATSACALLIDILLNAYRHA